MASKAEYFVESAEWVAGHGDVLVRQGCDALAGRFLVFCKRANGTWAKVGGPFDALQDAVDLAAEIPSVADQRRLWVDAVRGLLVSPVGDDLRALVDRLDFSGSGS